MRIATLRAPAAVLIAAAAFAVAAHPAAADIADKLDTAAPEIDCPKWVAGDPVQIGKLKGRVVVLHLTDPDRVTAQAAEPTLKKLAAAWKDAPVTFVEVVINPSEATAASWAAKSGQTWSVGWDGKGLTSARYAGTSDTRTYLVGPDGVIVFHAHVQAFTKEVVQGQVDRVQFFAPPPEAKKAKAVARAASEMRYGQALVEAARVEADRFATDADRALCKAVRDDVERTWKLQKKLLDAQMGDCDWGLAWRRAERMRTVFSGTAHEADANAAVADLEARPIVGYVRPAQDGYDKLIEEWGKARTKKDLEGLAEKVTKFADAYENTKPGDRAKDLLAQIRKRLEEMAAPKDGK